MAKDDDIRFHIQKALENDQSNAVIDFLISIVKYYPPESADELSETLTLLKARLKRLETNAVRGIISTVDFNLNKNQIHSSILESIKNYPLPPLPNLDVSNLYFFS